MREILFRGKTDKGKWVQGDLFEVFDDGFFIHDKRCHSVKIIPSTIGQYTGLTDKNGTKIFEGDIVHFKTTAYHFKNCRIKYQRYYGRYCAIDNKGYEYPMDEAFEYEVIGNIHDNHELLGGD